MDDTESQQGSVQLSVENIGGIDRTELSFTDGITILTGRNATNRTSLLRAIVAGLGSDRASLKGDAEEGRVRLQFGGDQYTRRVHREDGTVWFEGDAYLDDAELADLYAFLFASNEARRAVALQADLRDIVMRPVDAAAIRDEIESLRAEKASIEDELAQRESLERELSDLEAKRTDIASTLASKRETLDSIQDQLAAGSNDALRQQAERSELEAKLTELQETRSELETVEFRRENQREGLENLRADLAALESEQSEFPADVGAELDEIEAEIDRLRQRKQRLQTELSTLQSVIQFNEEMAEGTNDGVAAALGHSAGDTVTDQLLEEQSGTVCWTCGTAVARDRIEETLSQLREFRASKFGDQDEIDRRLAELKSRRSKLRSRRAEYEQIADDIEEIRAEIETREATLEQLDQRRDELLSAVDSLEEEIESLEASDQSDEVQLRSEASRLELEIDRLEENRAAVEESIADIESRLEELDSLADELSTVTDRIERLRTRVERIEREAIDAFNEHMSTVLDRLNYENLARIWLERATEQVSDGRETTTHTVFRLHVVRSTADGTTYEDEFAHLSESEREVTGLVFALAGYLVHDVYEEVPFLLLDSLEAIDSERIAELVEFFADYSTYLVVALLEEDAAALAPEYERISDI